jgi:hypothetical protein
MMGLDILNKNFEKISETFHELLEKTGASGLITRPEELYENESSFLKDIERFVILEFGRQYFFEGDDLTFSSAPQPSFNKEFHLLAEDLHHLAQVVVIADAGHDEVLALRRFLRGRRAPAAEFRHP